MGGVQSVLGRAFGRYLLLTNTASCGLLMAGGDLAVQQLEMIQEKDRRIDWRRVGRLGVTGMMLGPLGHYWYLHLDRRLPGIRHMTIVKKILADQIIAAPIFTFTFFVGSGTLEGRGTDHCLDEFKEKFWTVYKADWVFWPPAQYLNFYLLPPRFRVVYVAALTGLWDGFLSYVKHKNDDEMDTEHATTTTAATMTTLTTTTTKNAILAAPLQDVNRSMALSESSPMAPLAESVRTDSQSVDSLFTSQAT